MFIYIVVIAAFAYLASRIGNLEEKVSHLKTGSTVNVEKSESPSSKPLEEPLTSDLKHVTREAFPDVQSKEVPYERPEELRPPTAPVAPKEDMEFKLGGKLFTIIGVIALIVGVGLFLRYAFEQDLISEPIRVMMGILGGFILLGIGKYTFAKYKNYSEVISGGGIALLYLTAYASSNFYSLITEPQAFFGMIAVTIIAVTIALMYDTLKLMYLAQVGGFMTPILLQGGGGSHHSLFIYILLLNLGLIVIASRKSWRTLTILNLVGTVVIYLYWLYQFYDATLFNIALLYTTLYFATFLIVTIIGQLKSEHETTDKDIFILFAAPVLYYLANAFNIHTLHPDLLTWFTVMLGVLYLILAFTIKSKNRNLSFNLFFLPVSIVFFAVAIPIEFDGHAIAIGWGALALAVQILSHFVNSQTARGMSVAIFGAALVHLFAFDIGLGNNAEAWMNYRNLSFLLLGIFAALSTYLYCTYREHASPEDRKELHLLTSIFSVATVALFVTGLSLEIFDFHRDIWLLVTWLSAALLSAWIGNKYSIASLIRIGYILFALSFISIVTDYSTDYIPMKTVLNERVLMTLVAVLSLWIFLKEVEKGISSIEKKAVMVTSALAINGLLLWTITMEVIDYFDARKTGRNTIQGAVISIAWALYATALLIIGIAKRSSFARKFALVLFGVVIVKVFLIDTSNASEVGRFTSFIALGVILLTAGYLYYRFKDKIIHFIEAEKTSETPPPPSNE